jgi:predicted dehydrogenase
MSAWVGHDPGEVVAHETANGLDLHIVLRYADGSLATLTYATDGNNRYPKETLDVSGGGTNARLDNFARGTVWSRSGKDVKRSYAGQDKGQRGQVAAFVEAVRTGGPMPLTLDSLIATTRATIAEGESRVSGQGVTP